jgi:hypothetical protein
MPLVRHRAKSKLLQRQEVVEAEDHWAAIVRLGKTRPKLATVLSIIDDKGNRFDPNGGKLSNPQDLN